MEVAKPQNMIISQHKRTCYSPDGSVAKVDILRSIRRKDAEPSFLPSFISGDEVEGKKDQLIKLKDVFEYFLIATILICTLMLIMSFCGISFQLNTNNNQSHSLHQKPHTANTNLTFPFEDQIMIDKKAYTHNSSSQFINPVHSIYHKFIDGLKSLQVMRREGEGDYKLNLNKFRNTISDQQQQQHWQEFITQFTDKLNCSIQNNKIICQHLI